MFQPKKIRKIFFLLKRIKLFSILICPLRLTCIFPLAFRKILITKGKKCVRNVEQLLRIELCSGRMVYDNNLSTYLYYLISEYCPQSCCYYHNVSIIVPCALLQVSVDPVTFRLYLGLNSQLLCQHISEPSL